MVDEGEAQASPDQRLWWELSFLDAKLLKERPLEVVEDGEPDVANDEDEFVDEESAKDKGLLL